VSGLSEVRPVPLNLRNSRILPIRFEYYEPTSLDEALELLDKLGEEAKVLAGGTDLIVKMKMRALEPKHLINLKRIPNLNYIVSDSESIRIGALTTWSDLEKSDIVKNELPALYDAVKAMGSLQIRNMATLGGNLCNASPAADSAPPLLVYDAKVKVVSKQGVRVIPLTEFFLGPGVTALKSNEVLTEVVIDKRNVSVGSAFVKISRVATDLAIASAAVMIKLKDGILEDVKIALGSVAPTPVRAKSLEAALVGRPAKLEEVKQYLNLLEKDIKPIDDVRGTAWYRREVSKVLVYDAFLKALNRLGGCSL